MTDAQINVAIHAALGNPNGCPRCSDPKCAYNTGLNYTHNLNAMHEVEQTLSPKVFVTYIEEAMELYYEPRRAAARQRAEAFLRTLGKWEEAE